MSGPVARASDAPEPPRDAFAVRHPRPGLQQWRNLHNGIAVVEIHYSADPAKRSPEWKATTARGMSPRAWQREYEINWTAPEGEPVIPEYDPATHRRAFEIDPHLRLLRFWDFGFDSPVVLFAQLSLQGQLRIRAELCPFNTALDDLVSMVRAMTVNLMGPEALLTHDELDVGSQDENQILLGLPPRASEIPGAWDAGDPAGAQRTSLGCEIDILQGLGIRMHTIRPGTDESYQRLRSRFLKRLYSAETGTSPAILIHPECHSLHTALAGAFCRNPLPPYRPVKSHPHKDLIDALRYGNDNLDGGAQTTDRAMKDAANADRIDAVGQYGYPEPEIPVWAR